MNPIIEQLKTARQSLSMKQFELGKKLGLQQSHISKIESGQNDPRLSTIENMARILDHELMIIPCQMIPHINALLRGEESKKPRWTLDNEAGLWAAQLKVSLGNTVIGAISMLPAGSVFSVFSEEYMNDANRPVISQSFLTETGEVIAESKATRVRLPAFFSKLLPEGHMRQYLAERGSIKPTNEFKLI